MPRTRFAVAVIGCLSVAFSLLLAAPASAQVDARMLRYPDVSDSHISFVYAGDIWIVPKAGGVAQRLSTPTGEEQFPRFSPDGSALAFSANYDGNVDVYVVPTLGGQVRRVTHHPMADRMLDWHPDGQSILFASGMTSEKNRFSKLFRVARAGGLPEVLPVPYGEFGTVSPDGRTLAYMPISRDFRTWKRYRGGMAPEIWLFDLEDYSSRNVSQSNANDGQPMWHGTTLYFLSDRDENQRNNIWKLDAEGAAQQVTSFADFDVRFPAIGPEEIVFEAGGRLYLMNLASEQVREVEVDVVTDRSTLKPRTESVSGAISAGSLSPSGKRVIFEARGDLFSVPAENGFTRNLTRTSGVADRSPAWSPDGRWIAYFSDASGEYELTLMAADGSGEARKLTTLGEGYRYTPFWSPDSKKMAFVDQAMKIHVYDMDSEAVVQAGQGLYWTHGPLSGFQPSWSPDSRWLAWSGDLVNQHQAVFLFDTNSGEGHQVTSGFYSELGPVFDPDGNYLYVLTNRELSPIYSDFQNTWVYANATNVAAIALRDDVPSPLAPRNDEEPVTDDKDDTEEGAEVDGDSATDEDAGEDDDGGTQIDLENFERRLVVLPVEAGNYGGLAATSGKVIYHRFPRSGSTDSAAPIAYWDLEAREEKAIVDNAQGFAVSGDGSKMLVVARGSFGIVSVAPGQRMDSPLDLSGMVTTLDPVAEWRQIFTEVWRLFRDYFYVANMHGVDWQAMGERYSGLLDDVVTRWDLSFVINELIGELNAGHTYNRGAGDVEQAGSLDVGLLGVDFAVDSGAYRIARIIDGAPWDSEARSPLSMPGVDVSEGEYLLAVNGVPMDTARDPWSYFQGLAGDVVELTVNDSPSMDDARTVLVETLRSEYRLRHLAWIDQNRRTVEEASAGRVGYVYVPDTGIGGQTELMRQWNAQIDKPAMIIDERFNSGGQVPDRFVELLNRPVSNYYGVRDGQDWQWPPSSHPGPKVMLINGWSGSGGDAFPYLFREAGVGPLIGTRTWGGLIGISGVPQLIDGGSVSVPTFGIYSLEGEWIIEGHGVDPDIEVIEDPSQLARGVDPQLQRAISEVLQMLEDNPPPSPNQPAPPNRTARQR